MTTIAYKDGVLAGDGRISDDGGHIWTDKDVKVFELPDGSLFGAAGSEPMELLLKRVMGGNYNDPHMKDADIDAVLIKPTEEIFTTQGEVWSRWPEPFIAIGSGRRCALAALRLGHDALTAVKAGIEGDTHSGGKITAVKLKGKK